MREFFSEYGLFIVEIIGGLGVFACWFAIIIPVISENLYVIISELV